ncbi:hypothetical protein [Aquimarina muelleri]|uniref:Fimbrial assembly protein (PilN) n=1 Tax=Aquimarina muelleri TaxID=279356 RepID=A0A918N3H6_9FLAO|nr:hypothetical protein [Aquimarina muelleri]MCX2762922.1 hypothetical protein [Aquimarina muelleri]GGX27266.1 hypothetical protein GCM10007384_30750 [Aquimarina muelleri]
MLDKLKNINLFQEKKFAIIGIIMADVTTYEVLIVDKISEQLSIADSFFTTEYNKLKERVGISTPVLCNFSGKGIINKKVASKSNYLKDILFNANADDFYIYEVNQGNQEFVSLARKEVLNTIFNQFREDKYLVLDYSIGPFVSIIFEKIIDQNSFLSGSYLLHFEEGSLIEYQKKIDSEETYVLGKDKISSKQIVLFSTLLNHLYPLEVIRYDFEFLKLNKQELLLKKTFNNGVVLLGIFFLGSLLISYLLLNYYNNRYITYESQLYNLNHTYEQVKKLEKEKQNKALVLQESGVLKNAFLSYYIQEIIDSIPNEIILSSLVVNPNNKKIKNFEKIFFETNTILIEGDSKSSIPLNDWVKSLKKQDWLLKIEILDYNIKRKESGKFILKLIVK